MPIDLMNENGFTLKKTTSRQYITKKKKMNAKYADDLVLLINTPAQTKTLLLQKTLASM